jgi:hypothetical protein
MAKINKVCAAEDCRSLLAFVYKNAECGKIMLAFTAAGDVY